MKTKIESTKQILKLVEDFESVKQTIFIILFGFGP